MALRSISLTSIIHNYLHYCNSVSSCVCLERAFKDLVPARDGKDNLYTHLFRSVYSTIATFWFCPPAVPELEFRAAIQGHYKVLEEGETELRRSLCALYTAHPYSLTSMSVATTVGVMATDER